MCSVWKRNFKKNYALYKEKRDLRIRIINIRSKLYKVYTKREHYVTLYFLNADLLQINFDSKNQKGNLKEIETEKEVLEAKLKVYGNLTKYLETELEILNKQLFLL